MEFGSKIVTHIGGFRGQHSRPKPLDKIYYRSLAIDFSEMPALDLVFAGLRI